MLLDSGFWSRPASSPVPPFTAGRCAWPAVLLGALLVFALACGGDSPTGGRDGRLEMAVRFLASDQEQVRQRLAGLRMCARNLVLADERCVDVVLSDQEEVRVALNVSPGDGWSVNLWAFDRGGQALWAGRARANVRSGESTRQRVLLSRCSTKTAVECSEDKAASSCHEPRPRAFHTSTLLPGGLVLLAGGFTAVAQDIDCGDDCRVLVADDTAEIYDPVLGRVTQVMELARPRAMHTATLTSDGRYVVIAGGYPPRVFTPMARRP